MRQQAAQGVARNRHLVADTVALVHKGVHHTRCNHDGSRCGKQVVFAIQRSFDGTLHQQLELVQLQMPVCRNCPLVQLAAHVDWLIVQNVIGLVVPDFPERNHQQGGGGFHGSWTQVNAGN